MSLTEAEARVKWCPFARLGVHAGSGGIAVNRHPLDDIAEDCLCIASDCMAWRWSRRLAADQLAGGYCGLAGQVSALASLSPTTEDR